jgi:hypothetical protein
MPTKEVSHYILAVIWFLYWPDFVCPDPPRREQNQGVYGYFVFSRYNVLGFAVIWFLFLILFFFLIKRNKKYSGFYFA